MITFPKNEEPAGKQLESIATVSGTNLKKESSLIFIKDRPLTKEGESVEDAYVRVIQAKEEEIWRDNHPGKELFVTVCNLCKARHLLDFDADKKHFECSCEIGPTSKEQSHYYVCNAGHSHYDIKKSFNKTKRDCKICDHMLNAQTKKEAEFNQKVRERDMEEIRTAEKLRKAVEDRKAEDKTHQKLVEAELFAATLAKQLTPLFEDLKKEIRIAKAEK